VLCFETGAKLHFPASFEDSATSSISKRYGGQRVPMIRRRIERIELQWSAASIDDIVIHPRRDEHGEARADRRPNAIENGFARPFFTRKN